MRARVRATEIAMVIVTEMAIVPVVTVILRRQVHRTKHFHLMTTGPRTYVAGKRLGHPTEASWAGTKFGAKGLSQCVCWSCILFLSCINLGPL